MVPSLELAPPLRYLHRNHRKLLVVDQQEAFLGGFNIRRENSRALSGERRQRDTHVHVGGELARQAAALFDHLWSEREPPQLDALPEHATENAASRRSAGPPAGSYEFILVFVPFR